MEWITSNDGISILIAFGALLVSLLAIMFAYKTASTANDLASTANTLASRSDKVERRVVLSGIHAEVSPGRQAMETIVQRWSTQRRKDFAERDQSDENDFVLFYNENYHNESVGTTKKSLSNGIHQYLYQLDQLWLDIRSGSFDSDEVMKMFGDGLCMDEEYIRIYLRAHREAHQGKCFWEHVPEIVEAAKLWSPKQIRNTEHRGSIDVAAQRE